jgi:hypothetical protein
MGGEPAMTVVPNLLVAGILTFFSLKNLDKNEIGA